MARTKARYLGRILRHMFRDGGSVVLMARLEHDPDRVTELRVNRSSVPAFMVSAVKAAELSEPEITGMIESLGKLLPSVVEVTNGKHHTSDEW